MRDSVRLLTNFTDMRIGATPVIDAGTLSLGPTATAAITDGQGPSNGGSRQFAGIRRVHLVEADRASRVLIAAAHEVDHGREFGASTGE
jgi:hypothetical protein